MVTPESVFAIGSATTAILLVIRIGVLSWRIGNRRELKQNNEILTALQRIDSLGNEIGLNEKKLTNVNHRTSYRLSSPKIKAAERAITTLLFGALTFSLFAWLTSNDSPDYARLPQYFELHFLRIESAILLCFVAGAAALYTYTAIETPMRPVESSQGRIAGAPNGDSTVDKPLSYWHTIGWLGTGRLMGKASLTIPLLLLNAMGLTVFFNFSPRAYLSVVGQFWGQPTTLNITKSDECFGIIGTPPLFGYYNWCTIMRDGSESTIFLGESGSDFRRTSTKSDIKAFRLRKAYIVKVEGWPLVIGLLSPFLVWLMGPGLLHRQWAAAQMHREELARRFRRQLLPARSGDQSHQDP